MQLAQFHKGLKGLIGVDNEKRKMEQGMGQKQYIKQPGNSQQSSWKSILWIRRILLLRGLRVFSQSNLFCLEWLKGNQKFQSKLQMEGTYKVKTRARNGTSHSVKQKRMLAARRLELGHLHHLQYGFQGWLRVDCIHWCMLSAFIKLTPQRPLLYLQQKSFVAFTPTGQHMLLFMIVLRREVMP